MTATRSDAARLAAPLRIGDVVIANRVFLAPMSGISDKPFRALVARLGAGLVYSEMVAGETLAAGHPESVMRAETTGIGPHVVQLAGRETRWMAEGARAAADAGADIIDINMGCPAKKVTGGYSGSALMRDLDHAERLIAATTAATDRPVTLKMRLGWDMATMNAPELARRAEAAGVRMVTVHGRTRMQFYSGRADWQAIRAVKEAVSIPVIANGDLVRFEQLGAMLAASGADGVMIGRGACGRPWLPGAIAAAIRTGTHPVMPDFDPILDLVRTHFTAMIAHYGPGQGVRNARKHLGWYLDALAEAGSPTDGDVRRQLLTEGDPSAVRQALESLAKTVPTRMAA